MCDFVVRFLKNGDKILFFMKQNHTESGIERQNINNRRNGERRAYERRDNDLNSNVRDNRVFERRKVSYVKPFFYYFLQISLLIPILGIIELNLNPLQWSAICYGISTGWIIYTTKSLLRVLARQKFQAAMQPKTR